MYRLADFLKEYDTVIFDMDGVVTSEQNYWNCAALTVYEFLHSKKYFGKERLDTGKLLRLVAEIRREVFCGDMLIEELKNKGVNSNWDLAYIVIGLCVCRNTQDFKEILGYERACPDGIMQQYDALAQSLSDQLGCDCSRSSPFWNRIQSCFQEWFLGDELFRKTYRRLPVEARKSGLIYDEEPLIDRDKLVELFRLLHDSGKRICTGTGRPRNEILSPLQKWGIFQYFAEDGLINYDYVENAEHIFRGRTLTKPHPYMFLKALYGEDYSDADLLIGRYDADKIKRTLVVGDAGADIGAAKAMGADFCAVLTGVTGDKMRAFFEENHAEYICASIEDFLEEYDG